MKSLSDLPPADKKPEEEQTVPETNADESGDGSILLLALLLSRLGGDSSGLIESIAPHISGGEKLRLALKFGSELKRCGDGLSGLKVVSRYTKRDMGNVEQAMARSEQLRQMVSAMRSGGTPAMDTLMNTAGINPAIAALLQNRGGGGLSPEMLMSLLGRR